MNRLKQKLSGQTGASIVIALLFFLICATVGAVVLGMAQANSGHIKTERENENGQLGMMSGAELVKSKLQAAGGSWHMDNALKKTEKADDSEKKEYRDDMLKAIRENPASDALTQKMNELMYQVYLDHADGGSAAGTAAPAQTETVTVAPPEGSGLKKVTATITVTADQAVSDEQLQEVITVDFTDADGTGTGLDTRKMKLTMSGTVNYALTETVTTESEKDKDGKTTQKTYYSYSSDASISTGKARFAKPSA